jgi:dihydroorotate dehydrogenase electron transfer subunit
MTECNPLHAAHYPDQARCTTVPIVENGPLARDTHRVRIQCPEIARTLVPGQFVMMRLAGFNDPLIGRALAVYDTFPDAASQPAGIDVVYMVKGKFTHRLAECRPGQLLDVWGPLGNGFEAKAVDHLILVAGGIGQTPFVTVAQEALGHRQYGTPPRSNARCGRVTLCYGARSADMLAGVGDFEQLGVDVQLATEDGSRGHRGFVTDVLAGVLRGSHGSRRILCCGPERMMQAVAGVAAQHETPCEVSLESPMACGIGICFSCVVKLDDGQGGWDYRRTCVEGPVFDAAKIRW